MLVSHEIPDQTTVIAYGFGALSVGDPGGLYDRVVVAHVINKAYKAVVQYREGLAQDLLQFGHTNPFKAFFFYAHERPPGDGNKNRILMEVPLEGKRGFLKAVKAVSTQINAWIRRRFVIPDLWQPRNDKLFAYRGH
jgi:hypothetical protein